MIQGVPEKHLSEVQANDLLANVEAQPARVVAIVRERNVEKGQHPFQPEDNRLHALTCHTSHRLYLVESITHERPECESESYREVVSVNWWKSIQRVINRRGDRAYAACFIPSMS